VHDVLIVFNPAAGAGRRRRLARALLALRAQGLVPEVAETAGPGHATRLTRDAVSAGHDVVVAAGGDGTIAEVAAGLLGGQAQLGLLPLGTANVLAWELGIPLRPEAAAQVLGAGRAASLHPGLAHFADGSTRLFVQMLGAGFDAAVVAALDLDLKRLIGRGAYAWQMLRELPRYRFPPIVATLDGCVMDASSVIVTKGRLYAGRYLVAPGADPTAPGFHVVMFTQPGPMPAALTGAALPLGLVPHLPGVCIRRAARITLAARHDSLFVQADGDPAGVLPVTVEAAPGVIRILLPR